MPAAPPPADVSADVRPGLKGSGTYFSVLSPANANKTDRGPLAMPADLSALPLVGVLEGAISPASPDAPTTHASSQVARSRSRRI
eukprot:scaffold2419_cov114-Isochrysis_galbana.AAC.14